MRYRSGKNTVTVAYSPTTNATIRCTCGWFAESPKMGADRRARDHLHDYHGVKGRRDD